GVSHRSRPLQQARHGKTSRAAPPDSLSTWERRSAPPGLGIIFARRPGRARSVPARGASAGRRRRGPSPANTLARGDRLARLRARTQSDFRALEAENRGLRGRWVGRAEMRWTAAGERAPALPLR